jgi:hypothetical protein
MTPDVCLRRSSLVCRRTRQEMTHRPNRQTMIRSQACIGARRSSVTTRAGRMADRGYLHDGAWTMLTNLVKTARRVAAMVGLTVAASSIYPPVPWMITVDMRRMCPRHIQRNHSGCIHVRRLLPFSELSMFAVKLGTTTTCKRLPVSYAVHWCSRGIRTSCTKTSIIS